MKEKRIVLIKRRFVIYNRINDAVTLAKPDQLNIEYLPPCGC